MTGFSISHVNAFNRELSESEVAEHYVYDDDLLFAGVLGYDAMTASQRNGLVYSSSYTNTISIAGNEFTDKSGNGVTLSPQPTLTGAQIYVYTDANDLPNSGGVPVVYSVNSADLDYFTSGNYFSLDQADVPSASEFTSVIFVKLESVESTDDYIFGNLDPNAVGVSWNLTAGPTAVRAYVKDGGSTRSSSITSRSIIGEWVMLAIRASSNGDVQLSINDDEFGSLTNVTGSINFSGNQNLRIGYNAVANRKMNGAVSFAESYNRKLTNQELVERYGGGIPPCYEDLSFKGDALLAYRVCDYNGNQAERMVDLSGQRIDLVVGSGTVSYASLGLSVECGGTPTPPSNALPSNLPTIL